MELWFLKVIGQAVLALLFLWLLLTANPIKTLKEFWDFGRGK